MTASLFESNQNTSHTITAYATDSCVVEGGGEHFKVDAISLDVIGVH
jgi:hypothetical protein